MIRRAVVAVLAFLPAATAGCHKESDERALPDSVPSMNAGTSSADDVFHRVSPVLQTKTRIPLRLPTYFGGEGDSSVFASLETATPARYAIELALTADCQGATACRLGVVTGEVRKTGAGAIGGTPVTLDRGIVGYFVDATCGASCDDSTLTWDEGKYRYSVGIKAAKKEELVMVANSAIANAS